MNDGRFQDIADAWMQEGPTQAPDRALQAVFRAIDSIPQERGFRVPLRRPIMFASIGIAAAVALAAAVLTVPFAGQPPQVDLSESPPLVCPDGSVAPSGSIVTVVGGGAEPATDGVPGTQASLRSVGVAVAQDGSLVVTDPSSVWQVGADGLLHPLMDVSDKAALSPMAVAFDTAGNLYITDPPRSQIWKRTPAGDATIFAGTGTTGPSGNDGPALEAGLEAPSTIAAGPDGSIYFDDHNNFRRVDPQGVIHAFAGSLAAGYSGDGGPAVDAALGPGVLGVAADPGGDVYLGDPSNHRVRRVDTSGTITTYAGSESPGSDGDGGPATRARLQSPVAVAVGPDGSVYVADDIGGLVRKVDPTGIISTVAGSGIRGMTGSPDGDCGPATEAALTSPSGLAVAGDGRLYVGERDGRIRAVVP